MNRLSNSDPKPSLDLDLEREVQAWLLAFQTCIRARDYNKACELFSPDVRAYGTHCPFALCLDDLVQRQWREEWPSNLAFTFSKPDGILASLPLIAVMVRWRSWHIIAGAPLRKGRATFLLGIYKDPLRLLCAHSHMSVDPAS